LNINDPSPNVPAGAGDAALPVELPVDGGQGTAPKKRRGKRRSGRNGAQEDGDAPSQAARDKQTGKGKGWRQTPILQSSATFQPYSSLKKNSGKGGGPNDNGWASEEVTDVQEMGDFDFEGSLAKFDKRNLFEQMRQEDPVDAADRLVSHNRQSRPKPGTAGGKNLHYSENVLDVPPAMPKPNKERPTRDRPTDFWNSEADDGALNGGERLSGRELGSRQSSRRGESKMSTSRRSQSRKASATTIGQKPTKANPGVSYYQSHMARNRRPDSWSSRSLIDKEQQRTGYTAPKGFHLLPSNRRVETVSALQMLNLENIAHTELGLTEDMMTENAGRGIAEVTLTALTDPAIKVRHAASVDPATGSSPPPTVVILAGNNKSGIRAVATGRHLRNKGVNVLVCVVGIERGERELLEDMRQQVRLFRNFGGRVFSKLDLFDHLRKASIPMLTIDTPRTSLASLSKPATVTLIIDALLGLAISFEELRTGDQATVYELIEWSNRNEAFVLAIDIPSGIDPSSGKVSIIDGGQLYVKPRYVVSMGAPKRGLSEAMAAGDDDNGESSASNAALPDDNIAEWKLFVVDLGLGVAVWKKAGTKIRRGIDFDDKWVLEMKYQGTPSDDDELV
jgi:enhancer of mRNA-decapping protein 3